MYDAKGYFFSDGSTLCIECSIDTVLTAGKDATIYQQRMSSHSGRAITMHNRRAVTKTLHNHTAWPSLYNTPNTYTRGMQRNDARAYAQKYGYNYPTLRTVMETALAEGKLWDKQGEMPSALSDQEEWFDDRQCDECNKSLGLYIRCVRENPESQGIEQCYCEDCRGQQVTDAQGQPIWTPGNPIVTDRTVLWIGRDFKLYIKTYGHDTEHMYIRSMRHLPWMSKERLASLHRLCWMSPELGMYVTLPWEKGERPAALRHVEYHGDWIKESGREWDGEDRRSA